MGTRRGNGDGSIIKRGDFYRGQVLISGVRHSVTGKTKREAQQKLRELQVNAERDIVPSTNRLTVAQHLALSQAMEWGMVPRNVADVAHPPRKKTEELHVLAPQEMRRLLTAAKGTRWEALFTTAVATGVHQGELLGLRWGDMDLEIGISASPGSMALTSNSRSRRPGRQGEASDFCCHHSLCCLGIGSSRTKSGCC